VYTVFIQPVSKNGEPLVKHPVFVSFVVNHSNLFLNSNNSNRNNYNNDYSKPTYM